MKRREFFGLIGGAVTWPLMAQAEPSMPVIGFMHITSLEKTRLLVDEFIRGLAEVGFVESKNVKIEYRWGQGRNDQVPMLVDDLVKRHVSVIVAMASSAIIVAAKAATQTIPIVFMNGLDPVKHGFVNSLREPGGNVTGVNLLTAELGAKRFELLHQVVPTAKTVAYLRNPKLPNAYVEADIVQAAARTFGVQLVFADASDPREIEQAFENVAQHHKALYLSSDSFFNFQNEQLVELAARYAVPTSYNVPYAVEIGGLMSYSTDFFDAWRQVGVLTGRILKGEKPATTPVQQSVKINLCINLKTAKTLGLTVPLSILGRADKVFE